MNTAAASRGRAPAPPHRKAPRWVILLIVLALLTGGGWAWQAWREASAKESAYITAAIQRGDIEDLVSATGSLQPRNYVDVGAQVSGQLRKLHVDVGSEVKEGDLLVEIDAEQSSARVDANRAQLRSLQAQQSEREQNLIKAKRDLQRQKNLTQDDATTTETLQNAETAVAVSAAQINALKAQMDQLKASMRVEEANLKYTKIYAPMSGTVVSLTARQGQTLNATQNAPTLLRIADQSAMMVQAQVSEADVSKLRIGMPVYFTTLGSQGRRWHGELSKIEPTPTVTNNVVLYNALFEVPNTNRSLMTQMTTQVFFVVAQARDVLLVPVAALTMQRGPGNTGSGAPGRRERPAGAASAASAATSAGTASEPPASAVPDRQAWQQMSEEERQRRRAERRAARGAEGSGPSEQRGPRQASVKVVGADGAVQEREVTVGIGNRVHAEVISGLKEGERVVAGLRQAEAPRRSGGNAPVLGQNPGGIPGQGGPGGAGAGGAGRGR